MADSFVGIKIKDLPEAQQGNLTDNSVAVVDDGATTRKTKLSTFAEWLNSKLGIGKIKEDINSLNSTLQDKSNTDHNHDERYYTESEIDEKIKPINSKFSSELTQGTSGSPGNQGVFKGQSGIMIIWGAHPTTAFAYDSGANYYYADISFRTAFEGNPIVMATPRFSGGIPENVGTLSVTPSKLRLGCNVQASGLYIEWIAVGKWK